MTAPAYQASPIKRSRSTKAEVEARREALLDIIEDGRPMTVRQVFYQPKEVWNAEIWDETVDILRANRAAMLELASELDRLGEVRGKVLRKILAAVNRRTT